MPPSPTAVVELVVLAVSDLDASRAFYEASFGWPSAIEEEGFVQFAPPGGVPLALYRRDAFTANTRQPLVPPAGACTLPVEVYLRVADLEGVVRNLLDAGARQLSPPAPRPWGDEAAYFADPDGHVLVVARPLA